MKPPYSPFTTQAISCPFQISTLTNVHTTTSHTQLHTSDHLHHTNIPTSSINSKKSKKSKKIKNPHRITIPKKHTPTNTNIFPATYIRLKRPQNSPLHSNTTKPSSSQTTTLAQNSPVPPAPQSCHYSTEKPLLHNQLPPILLAPSLSPQPRPTKPSLPTPSVPSTPTPLPKSPLPPTPVHKPISQYALPRLMQLNILILPRFCAPSTSITIPLLPYISLSHIFSGGLPYHPHNHN